MANSVLPGLLIKPQPFQPRFNSFQVKLINNDNNLSVKIEVSQRLLIKDKARTDLPRQILAR